jgi:hypothetical protein
MGYGHTFCQIENLPSSKSFEEEFVKSCSLRGSYTETPEDLTFPRCVVFVKSQVGRFCFFFSLDKRNPPYLYEGKSFRGAG